MPKGFFITGTDTGVGKTVIAAALIKAIGLLGIKTGAMKPVETGCMREGDTLVPSDGMFLKEIAHMDEALNQVTPCCFEHPLSPLAAADLEETAVDLSRIQKVFKELSARYEAIVVEGIGGLLVPLKEDYSALDLAKYFSLPVIVVARPGLGTINHTLLTVNYAIKQGIAVAGIVINYSRPPEGTLAEETNAQFIKKLSPVPVIGVFPYLDDMSSESIEKTVLENLDMEIIKRNL